jgi:D-alanyl-D-alanine carboxypeptidase (penicillin-binding protein 5/6)
VKRVLLMLLAMGCCIGDVWAQGAKTTRRAPAKKTAAPAQPQKVKGCISRSPYIGAVILDADSGAVLFEERANVPGYPASTLKLMTLLVIQEKIEAGQIRLDDQVKVSVEAYKTGGSQVYLDPKETFTVEEMLYAMIIQSANDAAVALAEHVAGSKEAFLVLMNARAEALGMRDTRFASVHGLPPSAGQRHDVSTARDMAILARELCRYPAIFAYTSATYRQLRANTPNPFDMRTHNPFLKEGVDGCDGFKTGYTATAGWSIVVTAKRNGRRVIVVVLGSEGRKQRDAEARALLNRAFTLLQPEGAPAQAVPHPASVAR